MRPKRPPLHPQWAAWQPYGGKPSTETSTTFISPHYSFAQCAPNGHHCTHSGPNGSHMGGNLVSKSREFLLVPTTLPFVIRTPPYIAPGGGFKFSVTSPWGVKLLRVRDEDPGGWIQAVGGIARGGGRFLQESSVHPGGWIGFRRPHPGGWIFRRPCPVTLGGGFDFSARLNGGGRYYERWSTKLHILYL